MNIYNEEFCREHKISTLTKLFLVLIGTAENSEPFFMQKKKNAKRGLGWNVPRPEADQPPQIVCCCFGIHRRNWAGYYQIKSLEC